MLCDPALETALNIDNLWQLPFPSVDLLSSHKHKENQRGNKINMNIKDSDNWGYIARYPSVYKKILNDVQ